MPLPLVLLDLPPAVEHQAIAHQAIAAEVSRSQPQPSSQPTIDVIKSAPQAPVPSSAALAQSSLPLTESPTPAQSTEWVDQAVPAPARSHSSEADGPNRATVTIDPPENDAIADGPEPDLAPGEAPIRDQAEYLRPTATESADELPASEAPSLRVLADRQTFDPQRQVVTANGDVLVQFGTDQLAAERLWVNLNNRYLRAEGDVFFNRNEQILEGDVATYNLLQGSGTLTNGRGTLQVRTVGDDFSTTFPNDLAASTDPIDYRLQEQGTISEVTSPGGLSLTTDARERIFGGEQGDIGRIRFETSELSFDADGWYGQDVRLTNDPFSPPELEFRGSQVRLTPLNEEEDELCIDNPRVVFDQGLTIPILRRCYLLQRGRLPANAFNPLPTNIGYDNRDRDGLFIERELAAVPLGGLQLSISPQFYISRWLSSNSDGLADLSNFGLVARLRGTIGDNTTIRGVLNLPGLDLSNFTERARASLRVQRPLGTHRLGLEYTYRDRLFNGSLGFQDVQTSAGFLIESPLMTLGNTRINLSYQASGQYVVANTDRRELLDPGQQIGLTSLMRFQGAVDLRRGFTLWQGEPKPSTPDQGLRYSPRPIVPFLALITGLRGVATYYTSGDLQESLEARVTLAGQLGHHVRNYFDYTQFNIGLSSRLIGGDTSPFLFDRTVDQNVISGGITQQIYGPILAGFQTAFNLSNGQEIDTNFTLEYRRRTYGLLVRYSPTQETGFLGFRLSDFDWTGRSPRFDDTSGNTSVQFE